MNAIVTTESQTKLAEVESLAAKLGAAEAQLEHGYGKLAFMLKECSEQRWWEGSFDSFGAFLNHLKESHGVGRASLYGYLKTAKELDGQVSADQLSEMGISKAQILSAYKDNGAVITDDTVETALNPKVTAKELREILFTTNNPAPQEEGKWLSLDFEFYVTEEERLVLDSAANAARHMDPPIKDSLSKSGQNKEIALRWAQEFLAEYSKDVVEGGKGL